MKLIAAVVVLALVASTQAFPGSDQHGVESLFLKENSITCVLQYVNQVTACGGKVVQLGKETVADLKVLAQNLQNCASADEKIVCAAQAVRDSWEGSAQLRAKIEQVAKEAVTIANEIKTECFASSMY